MVDMTDCADVDMGFFTLEFTASGAYGKRTAARGSGSGGGSGGGGRGKRGSEDEFGFGFGVEREIWEERERLMMRVRRLVNG